MTGNSGRPRTLAFVLDNLLATAAAFLAVAALKSDRPYLADGALCLTYLGYFFLFEATWSRTPGKYLQGLAVVGVDGGRCGWRAALVRTLVRLVEANPLLFGGLPAGLTVLASKRNQRIGDLAAGTLASRPNRPRPFTSLLSRPTHTFSIPDAIHLGAIVAFSLCNATHL
jgi:uncharacterized RDD family membrane protein YckC